MDYTYEDFIYEFNVGIKHRPKKPDVFNNVSINTPYYFDIKAKKEMFNLYELNHKNLLKSFDDDTLIIHFNRSKYGCDKELLYFYDNRWFNNPLELELYIYAVDNNIDIERCPGYYETKDENMIYPDFRFGDKLICIELDILKDKQEYKDRLSLLLKKYPECEIWKESDFEEISKYIYDNFSDDYIPLFYKEVPFPWPNPDLRDTSPMGLVRHFHKSIYEARHKNEPNALELWNNKTVFKELALNRLFYVGECNPKRMLAGLNIAKFAMKVSVFKNTTAVELIKTYLWDAKNIFDCFSGFSARMLGAMTCGIPYIGRDINEKHIRESMEILDWWKRYKNPNVQVDLQVADATKSFGVYDCLLTCSPYAVYDSRKNKVNLEDWNNPDQIALTCDEWIDVCLNNYKCRKYVFVVDDTIIKYRPYIVGTISNNGHIGRNTEYIVYIDFTNYGRYIYPTGISPFDIINSEDKYCPVKGLGLSPFDI